jgi:nucleoside 2-deoxyribosyltransferase
MYFQIIMPVGSNPNRAEKEEIIKKAANNTRVKPHFPRYTTEDPVFNLQATLQDIRGAQFILADLSLERPSCYYELGLAEALGKPVFLIAAKGTDIHQTASRRLVRFYNDDTNFENLVLEIINEAVESK